MALSAPDREMQTNHRAEVGTAYGLIRGRIDEAEGDGNPIGDQQSQITWNSGSSKGLSHQSGHTHGWHLYSKENPRRNTEKANRICKTIANHPPNKEWIFRSQSNNSQKARTLVCKWVKDTEGTQWQEAQERDHIAIYWRHYNDSCSEAPLHLARMTFSKTKTASPD